MFPVTTSSNSERVVSMTAMEYVKKLGNGWNLGNSLDSSPWRDSLTPTEQEVAWGNPVTTREMIEKVKEAGFDIFRVPVTWCRQTDKSPDFKIKDDWLARVKEVIDYGYNLGLTVIVNMHHEDWHFPSEDNYPEASERLKKMWCQIAEYFKDYSDRLIFEAMNEPRKVKTEMEWNGGDEEGRRVVVKLNQDFVDTVRATGGNNASRMLLVPNYAASCNENAMYDFTMPNDENVILSLHGYYPYGFALGGEYNVNSWSESDRIEIDILFKLIDKYFISKGIPVIIGECGARKKGDNEDARVLWAECYTKKAREYGIPCIWWDNGFLQGPESMELFGLLGRHSLEWRFPNLVKAFVARKE
jgi:endoglucanase